MAEQNTVTVILPQRYIRQAGYTRHAYGPGRCEIPLAMAQDLVQQGVLPPDLLAPRPAGEEGPRSEVQRSEVRDQSETQDPSTQD